MGLPNPLWGPLRNIIVYNRRKIYIDNVVFRIHYTWTVMVLVAFSILVTSKLYIGDPINCMSSPDIKSIADEYCFIHSTYTRGVVEQGRWAYRPVKENEIEPGVHPAVKGEEIIYHTYYQWVWIVLSIQAISFFYPHWIWEKIEGGRIRMLIGDLNLPMLSEEKKQKQRDKIVGYFEVNRGYHTRYYLSYTFCELINIANIIIQTYATDYFLNHEFSHYGLNLFYLTQMKPYLRHDILARVFPTVTSCSISTGGVAFGKNKHDILCILPINIINEKIYIFIWYWFLMVACASIVGLFYRLLTFICLPYRRYLLGRRARFASPELLRILSYESYGDWFLIYKLGQNINDVAFSDVLLQLYESFRETAAFRRKKSRANLEAPTPNTTPESPFLEVPTSEMGTPFSTP